MTEKYATEYKNRNMLDENLDSLSSKYNDVLKELSKKEKVICDLNLNYNNLSKKYDSIANEYGKERIVLENEYKIMLSKKEEELKFSKSDFEMKMKRVDQIQKEEIKELEERVSRVIAGKESRIKRLEEELKIKEVEIGKYIEIVEELRNEYITK